MESNIEKDNYFMGLAINQALLAEKAGEVPVGAILVSPAGQVISRAHNMKERLPSPIGHAEILALHRAAKRLKAWRLTDCTLYVTLEPCAMCAGALIQSRIGRLVIGARDPKAGAVESIFQITNHPKLNHFCEVQFAIKEKECSELLKSFFKKRRIENKNKK